MSKTKQPSLPGMPEPSPTALVVTLRFGPKASASLRALTEYLRTTINGVHLTDSDAVRALITIAMREPPAKSIVTPTPDFNTYL